MDRKAFEPVPRILFGPGLAGDEGVDATRRNEAMLIRWAVIALAGAAGALSRYWLAGLVQRAAGDALPLGTAAVNLLGCFLFGVMFALFEARADWSDHARLAALVGFMGSFTTFSTYAFETTNLMRGGEWWIAAANVLGQNALGVALLLAGVGIGRWIA